jgi:MFS family permease
MSSAAASMIFCRAVLIAARGVQAVGAAVIVPTSPGLLYPSFPKRQHPLVVGIWAGVAGVAASAGPPVGGLLVSVDWRWIFLINLPIGVATIVAGLILLPEVRQPSGRSLPDVTSGLALLLGVSVLVLVTVEGPEWGWANPRTLGLFAAAVLLTLTTLQRTFKATSPIIEKELFRSREFTAATIALLAFFIGFSIFLLGGALFMQNVWHFSSLRAGLGIAPAPIVSVGFALSAGPIRARFGRTVPAVVGTLAMAAAALYWLIAVGDTPAYWTAMFPGLVIMGISGGLSQAPLFAAAGTLDPSRATTGSAVLNMSRQIGSALGVALLVALTATSTGAAGFHHAWAIQLGGGALAALIMFVLRDRRTTAKS